MKSGAPRSVLGISGCVCLGISWTTDGWLLADLICTSIEYRFVRAASWTWC